MKIGTILTIAFNLTGAATASESSNLTGATTTLISVLNTWLDTKTEFQAPESRPQIEFVNIERAELLHDVADRSSGRIRGLYDSESEIIYLVEPWSPENPRDISVLLHEMVHHRQKSQHWYCEQAQEWRAYQIQAQWLAEQQIADGFYWPAILLQSSCAKRDIHP